MLSSASEDPLITCQIIDREQLSSSFCVEIQANIYFLTSNQKEDEAYPLLKWPRLIGCKLLNHNNTIKASNGPVSLPYLRNRFSSSLKRADKLTRQ